MTESRSPGEDDAVRRIELDLPEEEGRTVSTFAQRPDHSVPVDSVGPGWDHYLDRLLRAHAGDDAGTVDRAAYYLELAGHYRAESC